MQLQEGGSLLRWLLERGNPSHKRPMGLPRACSGGLDGSCL
jgi:hypothetical protein